MIGEFNRRVMMRRWASTQDDGGSSTKVLLAFWELWAKVENRTGSLINPQAQEQWSYDYKVTVRYDRNKPLLSNDTIDYDGKRLKINSLTILNEGNRAFYVCRCSTIETLTLDTSFITYSVQTANYTGIGDEVNFTVTDAGVLINKTIVGAFKDGIEYKVIITGSPVGKEVKYTRLNGLFEWSQPYSANEHTLIQYTNV